MRFDSDKLLANCAGDSGSAAELLEIFCDWGMKQVDLIELSVDEGAWQDVHDLAHRFKGSLRMIAADSVATIAESLENQSAEQGSDPDNLFAELRRETAALLGEIEAFLEGSREKTL